MGLWRVLLSSCFCNGEDTQKAEGWSYNTLVWYPDPSVQAHARTRITACACGKEGSGEMVYPSAGPGM